MPVAVSLIPVSKPTVTNALRVGEKVGATVLTTTVAMVAPPISTLRARDDKIMRTLAPATAPNARPSVIQPPPAQSTARRSRNMVNRLSGSNRNNSDTGNSSGLKNAITGAMIRAKPKPIVPWTKAASATANAINANWGVIMLPTLCGELA